MEDDRISGLPEPLFKRTVVAVGFTPNLLAVLNEAHRLLKLLASLPIIVHVGEDTPGVRSRLEEWIERSNFRDHPPIYVIRAGNPSDVLVEVAREFHADLICAGALTRERRFRYYFGSIARNVARNAPCSVMLFAEPLVRPKPLRKIHCVVEYEPEAELAAKTAANIAYYAGCGELYLTHCFVMPSADEKAVEAVSIPDPASIYKRQDALLESYLKKIDFSGINIQLRCMQEKSRSTTIDFTRDIGADLLVIPTTQSRFGLWNRLSRQDVESALLELPCSLLLTRHSTT
ncbi:universal stress protein [candidate division KSB1 bacterium]|nr:universal stress protein [candidate division KSB1 bacterium]